MTQPPKGPTDRNAVAKGQKPRRRRANLMDFSAGARLKQARLLAGASQEELGKALGVSFQAVQKYENGENRLSVGRLAAAAKFLNVPTSFFFQDNDHDTGQIAETVNFTAKEIELVRYFRGVDEAMREQLLNLVRLINRQSTAPR